MTSIPPKKGYKTLPQAATLLSCQVSYLRSLLRDDKIEGAIKRAVNPSQWRWEIPSSWIEERRKTMGNRSKRPDGRNKYLIWMSPTELAAFSEMMKANLPEVPWEPAYKRTAMPTENLEELIEDEEDV